MMVWPAAASDRFATSILTLPKSASTRLPRCDTAGSQYAHSNGGVVRCAREEG
jgi:hypothetical protein